MALLAVRPPFSRLPQFTFWSTRLRAALLLLPLLLFLVLGFAWPIASLLVRSFHDPDADRVLPATARILVDWDGKGMPPAPAFRSLASELKQAQGSPHLARFAKQMAAHESAYRQLILRTANRLTAVDITNAETVLPEVDARWGDPQVWQALRTTTDRLSIRHLATAVDMRRGPDGTFERVPRDDAIYLNALARTFGISALVTVATALLAYPFAYGLIACPPAAGGMLMFALLVPFWTSLLVRTTGWVVLLQDQGLVNKALMALGAIQAPLALMFNTFGVVVAMVHVLLPFMVLPIYSAMKGTPHVFLLASASLGAGPWHSFRKVYLPLTMPGVVAGSVLVFTQALGYFITPALIGGPGDQMLGYFISLHANETLDWSLAAALAAMLLVATLALFATYARFASIERLGTK